jgi:dUTP pyrophosphatase
MAGPVLRFQVLPHGQGLSLPAYASAGAAGLDIRAAIDAPVTLEPGERALVPSGLRIAIPLGHEGQVRARSGLAWRQGLAVLNAPGTIDADYRGELRVILVNLGQEKVTVNRGDRIAQLVVAPVIQATVVAVQDMDAIDMGATIRGSGGFGSTGT